MSYNQIAEALIRNRLPYVCDDPTTGDGNCFFHGVLQQLCRENENRFANHMDLRRQLVEFVANDGHLQENDTYCVARTVYIEERMLEGESVDAAWLRLLHLMGCDGTWIEDVFILCMAMFLRRRVCLTSVNSTPRNPWIVFDGSRPEEDGWLPPIMLGRDKLLISFIELMISSMNALHILP